MLFVFEIKRKGTMFGLQYKTFFMIFLVLWNDHTLSHSFSVKLLCLRLCLRRGGESVFFDVYVQWYVCLYFMHKQRGCPGIRSSWDSLVVYLPADGETGRFVNLCSSPPCQSMAMPCSGVYSASASAARKFTRSSAMKLLM